MVQDDGDEPAELLCPNCLAPIDAVTHFCAKCTAPLTSHAATDPIGSIWASGYLYRTGIRSPRSGLILMGFWLLFGSTFLLNLVPLWRLVVVLAAKIWPIEGVSSHHGFLPLFLVFLFALAIEAIFAAALYQVTRNYMRGRRGDPRESHQ